MKPSPARYFGLDALRCFAMVMGLVIHAPIVFEIPEIVGYEVAGIESKTVGIIVTWIHSWRMPTFLLLAGFFAQMVLESRGVLYFLSDRLLRLLVPLLITTTTLNIIWDESLRLYHLWFLYYLILFSLLASLVFSVLKIFFGVDNSKFQLNSITSVGVFFTLSFLILLLLTALAKDNGLRTQIPDFYSDFSAVSILYHWFWFVLGQIFHMNSNVLNVHVSRLFLAVLFVSGLVSHLLLLFFVYEIPSNQLTTNVLSSVSSITWTMLLIGLSHKLIVKGSKTLNLFLELSYPVYLVHLAPAIVFGAIMVEFGMGELAIMFPNVILTGIFSVLFYFLIIKFTPLNWFVNGYKKSWFRPFGFTKD